MPFSDGVAYIGLMNQPKPSIILLLLGNTVVAALLTVFAYGGNLWVNLLVTHCLGGLAYLLLGRLHARNDRLLRSRLEEAEQERHALATHLKFLQARVEPDFLYSSLTSIAILIETQPSQARRLLDLMANWLRLALARNHSDTSSLHDELELVESWLRILSQRLGPRLKWSFDAAAATRHLPFPPMLLHPLVENAVHHGIEPKMGGGRLEITARQKRNRLLIEVRDNGVGLRSGTAVHDGTGLGNVRARLQVLFGDDASLSLTSNATGGVTATLEMPCPS